MDGAGIDVGKYGRQELEKWQVTVLSEYGRQRQ